MRFMMINLLLVCLLLFGIAYLAFGSVETGPNPETNAHTSIHYTDDFLGWVSWNVQGVLQNRAVAAC